jgi:hypothetical protein
MPVVVTSFRPSGTKMPPSCFYKDLEKLINQRPDENDSSGYRNEFIQKKWIISARIIHYL